MRDSNIRSITGWSRDPVGHRARTVAAGSFNSTEREIRAAAARVVVRCEVLQDQSRADRLPPAAQAAQASLTGDLYQFRVALRQMLDLVKPRASEMRPVLAGPRRFALPRDTDRPTGR